MEDFEDIQVRKIPITDLVRRKNYLEMVPRPTPEEYKQLKEDIERDGLNRLHPLVVNADSMVLVDGYTRVQIADELGIKEVYVLFGEFANHLDEKLFVLKSALRRRHLNTPQKSELYVQVLAVEEELARARQRLAGQRHKNNLKHQENIGEKEEVTGDHRLVPNSEQADEKGRAAMIVAAKAPIGHDTLCRAKKIIKTAQTDPEIAEAWDKAKQGQGSVNSVYQQVKEKEGEKKEAKPKCKVIYAKVKSWKEQQKEHLRRLEEEERSLQVPREELITTLREAARIKGLPLDAVEALMETDPKFLQVWKHMRLGLVTLTGCWCVIYWKLHVWLRAQRGQEPDEEFRDRIVLEMHKSRRVLLMQMALRLLKTNQIAPEAIQFVTGIDRKIFPAMLAWEDRLDLLAERMQTSVRRCYSNPENMRKAREFWEKGNKVEYIDYLTLLAMGDFQKKLQKEREQERQKFGRA